MKVVGHVITSFNLQESQNSKQYKTPEHTAYAHNLRLATFLLANGVDPNETQIHYRPAVVAAAGYGSCAMMELLLDHGAIIAGTDALLAAVFNHRIDMLVLLVEGRKVVDINAIQPADLEKRLSPGPVLHLAIRKKYRQMARVLVKRFHADPLAKDLEDKTAFTWAVEIGDPEIITAACWREMNS